MTATDIAQPMGLSNTELHRRLAEVGETFATLLQRCRLDSARSMLDASRFSRLTTAEIGRRVGFADPSHFVRAATRYLGMTPARYRDARQQ